MSPSERHTWLMDMIPKTHNTPMATIKRAGKPKPTIYKPKVEQMNKTGYTVLKLSDLVSQFGLPSSKGHQTKDYLELVIQEIEDRDYRFVQFLQLVDVLYVIVQKISHVHVPIRHVDIPASSEKFRPDEEIKNHYRGHPDPVINQQIKESTNGVPNREPITEEPPELAKLKERAHLDKNLEKKDLPWKK